jgi:hypothetical protein
LAPEVYQFAEDVLDVHDTLDPWHWSLINFTVAVFVFMDEIIHGSYETFWMKMLVNIPSSASW